MLEYITTRIRDENGHIWIGNSLPFFYTFFGGNMVRFGKAKIINEVRICGHRETQEYR
jgi:hypothetical protein